MLIVLKYSRCAIYVSFGGSSTSRGLFCTSKRHFSADLATPCREKKGAELRPKLVTENGGCHWSIWSDAGMRPYVSVTKPVGTYVETVPGQNVNDFSVTSAGGVITFPPYLVGSQIELQHRNGIIYIQSAFFAILTGILVDIIMTKSPTREHPNPTHRKESVSQESSWQIECVRSRVGASW
ncbi:hypothetical protein J6590_011552 [Homalodisca vitripennis]|nr:hypothetical protein J6590_011552 [Homalodisca vitripennis]